MPFILRFRLEGYKGSQNEICYLKGEKECSNPPFCYRKDKIYETVGKENEF